jgi:DNA-binding CsgD family transcriptional regulator
MTQSDLASAALRGLSPRQVQIIVLIASDKTDKEVAQAAGIAQATVGTYLRLIFAKLGVNSRAAMVGKAVWLGMVSLEGVYPSNDGPPRAPAGYVERT